MAIVMGNGLGVKEEEGGGEVFALLFFFTVP